jgi:hypothetical protein
MSHLVTITAEVDLTVERLIKETGFGSLILVVQDSRVVHLERNEKFQFPLQRKSATPKSHPVAAQAPLPGIHAALAGLQFGQVVVKIQEGRILQIDRTEKRRIPDLTGVSGDGI